MPIRFVRYRYLKRQRKQRYVAVTPPYPNCKNCHTELHGQFCSVCGQHAFVANQPLKESIMTYMDTNYAFDKKLGTTLYALFFRPGFLTREFMQGRIARHVHPFKLYFFASILFFGIALSVSSDSDTSKDEKIEINTGKAKLGKGVVLNMGERSDSAATTSIGYKAGSPKQEKASAKEEDDTESTFDRVARKIIEKNLNGKTKSEVEGMLYHNISLAMLLMMPIFALLLKLVYIRRKHYYLSHLIHAVHLHTVFFILMAIGILWDTLVGTFEISGWLQLVVMGYFVVSLARYYEQGWFKSLVKSFLLLSVYFIVCLIGIIGAFVVMLV